MDRTSVTQTHLTGLVLGKFLPPTLGHRYLIDFARSWCPDITVILGSLKREEIPGEQRVLWMREMFPDLTILHLTDENPQYPEDHPDFWQIWHDSIRRLIPTGPDLVFASEDYGFRLAEILGARYIPVDSPRELVPVSATMVRQQPMSNWNCIPECIRPWFVKRVCIIGPESTGKTILAQRLARHFKTKWVAEYARGYIDAHSGVVNRDMFPFFVKGQTASEEALARQANRILLCDTDPFTTALYHELYIGGRPEWILEEADLRKYDLYLLCSHEGTSYVEDSQRNHPDRRGWFFDECLKWLEEKNRSYYVIKGDWNERFLFSCTVIEKLVMD